MRKCGVYKIQSISNPDLCYIGSSVNMDSRINLHLSNLKNKIHHNKNLQDHFNKYGKNDLQFSVLLECNKENLIETEQFFLDAYDPRFNIYKKAGEGKFFSNEKTLLGMVVFITKDFNLKLRKHLIYLEETGTHKTKAERIIELAEIGLLQETIHESK